MSGSPDPRDLSPAELEAWVTQTGHPRYRSDQIMDFLYRDGTGNQGSLSGLPRDLREAVNRNSSSLPDERVRLAASDGTVKIGFRLSDGELVESVWMPEPGRSTICVSSQAGCRMACLFCRTGKGGFARRLRPSEMAGQVIAVNRALGRVKNVVFMGMGEPLDNLDNLLRTLEILCHQRGLGMAPHRITVSTIGIVEGIERLGREAPQVGLAVSLHSAVPATRKRMVPSPLVSDLAKLKQALLEFPLGARERITVEVVLVSGINDTISEARALANWLSGLRVTVNLIPFNPFPESELMAPEREAVLAYQQTLKLAGFKTFIRVSRGGEVLAACGQLLPKVI